MNRVLRKIYLCFILTVSASVTFAQQDFSQVEIQTVPVTHNIHMLMGRGGNIGVFTGDDGVFIIDDQFAPLSDKIFKAISTISDQPVRFVLNTHWHGDHTGGNENFSQQNALIIAHENVRKRLLEGQAVNVFNRVVPPASEGALPVITFKKNINFHWNGDTVIVRHVGPAHTDGDSVIYFKQANVIHMGDLYFNGLYPYIDTHSGGRVLGVITSIEQILQQIDDKTKIIPGHGPLSNKLELQQYHQMLSTVYTRILALKQKGKTMEQVIAAKVSDEYDSVWGNGFLKPDKWVEVMYLGI